MRDYTLYELDLYPQYQDLDFIKFLLNQGANFGKETNDDVFERFVEESSLENDWDDTSLRNILGLDLL